MKQKAALVVFVGALAVAFFSYMHYRPHINLATKDELIKLSPEQLVAPLPDDPGGEARYRELLKLALDFCQTNHPSMGVSASEMAKVPKAETTLSALLSAGPLRRPSSRGDEFDAELRPLARLSNAIGKHASDTLAAGDSAKCADLVTLDLKYAGAVKGARGTHVAYIVMTSLDTTATNAALRCARSGHMQEADLRKLIAAIPAGSESDKILADDWAIDYQKNILPVISDFNQVRREISILHQEVFDPKSKVIGSYDAKETARAISTVYRVGQMNAARPWKAQDPTDDQIILAQRKLIPLGGKQPADGWLNLLLYNLEMNSTPNSLGSVLIGSGMGISPIRRASVANATRHDVVRSVIALQLYKQRHSGSAAPDLVSLVHDGELPAEPVDWFASAPLRYVPQRGLVYSVGPNGVDDGNQFASDGWTKNQNFGLFVAKPKNH